MVFQYHKQYLNTYLIFKYSAVALVLTVNGRQEQISKADF